MSEKSTAKRLLTEINNRLSFLTEVGLDYLTLNRNSALFRRRIATNQSCNPLEVA
jgi:excinuclease UvrABC ATPase subunit